jgi:hypothetical protein
MGLFKIKNSKKEQELFLKEEEIQAYVFAIDDIKNGHRTLWTERLKKGNPELYKYSIEQSKFKEKFKD